MEQTASESTPRLVDRLTETRHKRFVGRAAELELFDSLMRADVPPIAVLMVHGPGGVGKSTLLREYARSAAACGRPIVQLDGRHVEPSPPGFMRALHQAAEPQVASTQFTAEDLAPASVLFIDTFERLAPLDVWLRETFLPQLSTRTLVVIASRDPPALEWRTDLAWAELTHVIALGNLAPEESQSYLASHGIPVEYHADVLRFSHGHPLALAIVADMLARGDKLGTIDPLAEPDVVRILIERLMLDVPTNAQRQALEVCALARSTTEALLGDALAAQDAHALFAWLRRLPFIEDGPYGLFPHDLAREVLAADLVWRDPERHKHLTTQIYLHVHQQFVSASESDRQRLAMDRLYAVRTRPTNQAFFDWDAIDVYAEPPSDKDTEAIIAMVATHQGAASARIARYWLERQPQAFLIFRGADGERFGFMALLELGQATADDQATDPAVAAALSLVEQYGPATPQEEIKYLRFWMHQEQHQAVTVAFNLAITNFTAYCTTCPNLAWSFVALADPDFWQPTSDGVNFPRAPAADFEVGGRRYGVVAHDWRVEPAPQWMALEHTPMPFAEQTGTAPQRVSNVALTRSEFATAVRQALRDFRQFDRLVTNPLLRTPLIGDGLNPQAQPALLQQRLREAVATLKVTPKDIKFHRALWHTYIEPAPTQARAAELLDLPFNTYRYHLTVGIERVTDWLWQQQRSSLAG